MQGMCSPARRREGPDTVERQELLDRLVKLQEEMRNRLFQELA